MNHGYEQELQQARKELEKSQAELEALQKEIHAFEEQVDSHLGSLLDHLSRINSEIFSLNDTLHQIREQRLYGKDRIRNLGATTLPSRPNPLDGAPILADLQSQLFPAAGESSAQANSSRLPDIRQLYRQLARQYHPDLARSDLERLHLNDMMVEINQFYREENKEKLMELAGIEIPFYLRINQVDKTDQRREPLSELEQVQLELEQVQAQITRLSRLPSVKLSLEVKLTRMQGRDLLSEMAIDLKHRLERRLAERDYLRAQVHSSGD